MVVLALTSFHFMLQLITILNRCHRFPGFVYQQARFSSDHKSIEIDVRPRKRSAGAEVIRACNRLGIVIDLTHMSYDAVKAALKISTQPVIFSHTALRPGPGEANPAPDAVPRLLSREEAEDIAGAGGIIGVWTRGSDTAKEYAESIRRVADVAGIDHVGIGTDTDLEPIPPLFSRARGRGRKKRNCAQSQTR